MSIPSDRRSVSSILNNLIGRVRVLEALPSSASEQVQMYATAVNLWVPQVDSPLGYDYESGSWYTVPDSTSPTGFFFQNGPSGGPWDSDVAVTFYTRLGPQGSLWLPSFGFVRAATHGAFKIEIATIEENTPGEYPDDPLNGLGIADPYYPANPTFYYPDGGSGNVWVEDCATGSASITGSQVFDRIRLMGTPGTQLTANPDPDLDGPGGFNANSGPGLYAIKVTATGADVGSSAQLQFWGMSFVRTTSNYYPFS